MAPTREAVAKLVTVLTGISERTILEERLNRMSDADFTAMLENLRGAGNPDDIFPASSIADLAASDTELHTDAEAVLYAATLDPDQVFTGAEGLAKLDAWAIGAGYTAP